jgi:Rod binding domain-containing protein
MYEEMLDDAMSGNMAASGQLGVSHMLEQQLRIADLQKKIHGSGVRVDGSTSRSKAAAIASFK